MDSIPGGIVANFVGKNALGDLANGIRAFEDLDPKLTYTQLDLH